MLVGEWIDDYQAVGQAPVDFIRGSRTRYFDGLSVKGSWSDPWWMFSPEHGWAIAKTWKNKAGRQIDWRNGHSVWVDVPERNEIVITNLGRVVS